MSELVSKIAAMVQSHHVVQITFPAQGHINPSLEFAKKLTRMGVEVTFMTTVSAHRRMSNSAGVINGLNFASFSDGGDDGKVYMAEMKTRGSETLRDIIVKSAEKGRPITTLVYTLFVPWAAEVVREFHIPSALLWIQPATVFDVYYYYFNGSEDDILTNCENPNWSIELPGLPILSKRDLPSFLLPCSGESRSGSGIGVHTLREQFNILDAETNPKVLVNTFDALEPEELKAIEKYNLIPVGPLVPSVFLNGRDPSDTSFSGDLFEKSKDCAEWLNSRPDSSVVYISFGSLLNLQKEQLEEIARGLLDTGRPFLWVIRPNKNGEEQKEEDKLSCLDKLEEKGMIVEWCSQLEVLTHSSLGCFVTHCGWNSTLESMVCGIPVIAFPQWSDQGTNAKLIEDIWKIGVRVTPNKNGIVESDEIKNCIEMVMEGEGRGLELRRNAMKWKVLAREAMQEGSSSYKNLESLVHTLERDGGSLGRVAGES